MNNIYFLKFCYMYSNKNYKDCLNIIEKEKNSLLNLFPEFFINMINVKLNNNNNLNSKIDFVSIIDQYINYIYKEDIKYCFSFILAEYIYKFLDEENLLYEYLLNFCLSSDSDELVRRYMLDWCTEKNYTRKKDLLNEVFTGFSVDFHNYLKDAARSIYDKNI